MRINVLHIAFFAAPYGGNFIQSLEQLSRLLAEDEGSSVYMFPCEAKNGKAVQWLDELKKNGREIHYFTGNITKDALQIRRIVVENDIQVVHTHFLQIKYQLSVTLACTGLKVKRIIHFHTISKEMQGFRYHIRKLFYRSSIMIACSEAIYGDLCRDYPANLKFCVENGIDTKRLETFEKLSPEAFGFSDDKPMCLMFGGFFEIKGVDIACVAIRELRRRGTEINLLISVSTNRKNTEAQIEKLLGEMPSWIRIIEARSDVASLYNAAQLFLAPSRTEGLPYAVLEASWCQCAVVLSDIPAQKKLKIPYAQWFESENAEALCNAILEGLKTREEKEKHLEEARRMIEANYDIKSWAKGMAEIYEKCFSR